MLIMEIKITKTTTPKQMPPEETLGFGKVFTDHMFIMNYTNGKGWHDPRIVPFQDITLSPAAMVYHYGQEMFEGLKAYRTKDGSIVCFRPDLNAARLADSCRRMIMPVFPEDKFVDAVVQTVRANADWVPPLRFGCDAVRPSFHVRR